MRKERRIVDHFGSILIILVTFDVNFSLRLGRTLVHTHKHLLLIKLYFISKGPAIVYIENYIMYCINPSSNGS